GGDFLGGEGYDQRQGARGAAVVVAPGHPAVEARLPADALDSDTRQSRRLGAPSTAGSTRTPLDDANPCHADRFRSVRAAAPSATCGQPGTSTSAVSATRPAPPETSSPPAPPSSWSASRACTSSSACRPLTTPPSRFATTATSEA